MRIHSVALVILAACLGAGVATLPAGAPAAAVRSAAATAIRPAVRKKTGRKTHQATGEVVSISGTKLVLLHARGRTKQRMTFVLTPKTKKEGRLVQGERITVYYFEDAGHLLAKRLRPAPAHHRARKPTTAKAKG